MKLTKVFIIVVMTVTLLMPSFDPAPAPKKIAVKAGKAIVSSIGIFIKEFNVFVLQFYAAQTFYASYLYSCLKM